MAYTVLYRKKRPLTFAQVVGQPHVVRTLHNQLAAEHITHAYLFCGTRGTGKTTTARVFARAVNCENPRNGEPCNECDTCLGILAERNLNVIELDAASNNGVENIRDLREEVKYPPTEGRYRVYIIDEAHMLTSNAFNALLKTLEEPPPHVIFILATTDPQKIPITILSRCQRYDFKRISADDIVSTLQGYLEKEQTEVEYEALRYIASVSDGAMRDALSILDQCLSYYEGETLTLGRVLSLLGAVDRKVLFDFTGALAAFDSGKALAVIGAAVRDGRDIGQFAADCTRHFRDLLVVKQISGENAGLDAAQRLSLLDVAPEMFEQLKTQAETLESETLILYIRAFSELQNELRYAAHARLALEVCAVKLCHPSVLAENETVLTRLAKLEQAVAAGAILPPAGSAGGKIRGDEAVDSDHSGTFYATMPTDWDSSPADISAEGMAPAPVDLTTMTAAAAVPDASLATPASSAAPPSAVRSSPPLSASIPKIQKEWTSFCAGFSPLLKKILANSAAELSDGNTLLLVFGDESSQGFVKDRRQEVVDKLAAHFKLAQPPNLAFEVRDGYNNQQRAARPAADKPAGAKAGASAGVAVKAEEDEWAAFGEQVNMGFGEGW